MYITQPPRVDETFGKKNVSMLLYYAVTAVRFIGVLSLLFWSDNIVEKIYFTFIGKLHYTVTYLY